MSTIEALYILSTATNSIILQHWWRRQSVPIEALLPHYVDHPATPPPELLHIASTSPPVLLFNIRHNDLVLLAPTTGEAEPLLVLELLHRVVDVLEDYFSPPLLATKIESNYDTIVQLLGEMCDDGNISNTEPNALRDIVLPPTLMGKLLGSVAGLPSSLPSLQPGNSTNLSAIPWRRSNVKHVNNELYVDIIEIVEGIFSPSGQPLKYQTTGTITVNSKLSGVPDLLLTLRIPDGGLKKKSSFIEYPCFHPCVRLSRWNEHPGELSFVPPDGKFILATYEADLLPAYASTQSSSQQNVPITAEIRTLLGELKTEFEVVLSCSLPALSTSSSPMFSGNSNLFSRYPASRFGNSSPSFGGSSNHPAVEEIVATIPLPPIVKSLTNIRASKGDYQYETGGSLTWKLSGSQLASDSTATLKAEIVTKASAKEVALDNEQQSEHYTSNDKIPENSALAMPHTIFIGFSIKGWLGSGIRVDGLKVMGRGLGEGVKPYKGVKYISKAEAIEFRC